MTGYPQSVFVSDPEAEAVVTALREAWRDEDGDEVVHPVLEIRCSGNGGLCGQILGGVWFTEMEPVNAPDSVLFLHYWTDGASRTKRNRREMFLFLQKMGDHGLYSCPEHGTWRADLGRVLVEYIRGLHEEHTRGTVPLCWVFPVSPPSS